MLAATTAILATSRRPIAQSDVRRALGARNEQEAGAATGRRTGADQLAIAVNPEFEHKLMLLKDGNSPKLKVGTMEFIVIGPSEADLKTLRDEWNDWLRDNKEILADIRRKAKADEDLLTSNVDRLLAPLTMQANSFVDFQIALAKKLGDRAASHGSESCLTHVPGP